MSTDALIVFFFVFYSIMMAAEATPPASATPDVATAAAPCVANYDDEVRRRQVLGKLTAVKDEEWVPDSARPNCKHCGGVFGLVKRRHHCRCCGDVFCADCLERAVMCHDRGPKGSDGAQAWEKESLACVECRRSLRFA